MAERPGQHRLGQVEAPAAVADQRGAVRPVIFFSASKPTSQVEWNGCRLPDMVMSWVRFSRSRTGRPVSLAPSAAMAA